MKFKVSNAYKKSIKSFFLTAALLSTSVCASSMSNGEMSDADMKSPGQIFSDSFRHALQKGGDVKIEEGISSPAEYFVRVAIEMILESLRLQEMAKHQKEGETVDASRALNVAQQTFSKLVEKHTPKVEIKPVEQKQIKKTFQTKVTKYNVKPVPTKEPEKLDLNFVASKVEPPKEPSHDLVKKNEMFPEEIKNITTSVYEHSEESKIIPTKPKEEENVSYDLTTLEVHPQEHHVEEQHTVEEQPVEPLTGSNQKVEEVKEEHNVEIKQQEVSIPVVEYFDQKANQELGHSLKEIQVAVEPEVKKEVQPHEHEEEEEEFGDYQNLTTVETNKVEEDLKGFKISEEDLEFLQKTTGKDLLGKKVEEHSSPKTPPKSPKEEETGYSSNSQLLNSTSPGLVSGSKTPPKQQQQSAIVGSPSNKKIAPDQFARELAKGEKHGETTPEMVAIGFMKNFEKMDVESKKGSAKKVIDEFFKTERGGKILHSKIDGPQTLNDYLSKYVVEAKKEETSRSNSFFAKASDTLSRATSGLKGWFGGDSTKKESQTPSKINANNL